MKILDRYIAGVVAVATGLALLVIVGLDLFFSIINQIDEIGKGTYGVGKMLQYVALGLPRTVYEFFPTAALLGGLTGMGMLAANSELIAMRAGGMSVWRIVRSLLQVGLIMLIFVVALGEGVAPVADQLGQRVRAIALEQRISFIGGHGLWVRDESRYIYVNRIIDNSQLANLSVFEFDDRRELVAATHAASAGYLSGEWTLRGVRQTLFEQDRVKTHRQAMMTWPSLLTPELIDIVALKPEHMAINDIRQFVAYLEDNGLDTQQYRYAFWGRFITPLSALVMLFISVPFVFGSLRAVGSGQRIFIGTLAGFGFYLASQVAGQMGQVYGLNPLLVTLAPSLLVLMLGVRAIRRI
jgi:lipopolysaccharide export system permease protein